MLVKIKSSLKLNGLIVNLFVQIYTVHLFCINFLFIKICQVEMDVGSDQMIKFEDKLKVLLTPQYLNLFKLIGRLEKGVKFLVDMRTDVLVS